MTYNMSDVHMIRRDLLKIMEGILSLRNINPSIRRVKQDQTNTVEYNQSSDDNDNDDIAKLNSPFNPHDCDKRNINQKSDLGQEDSKVLYKRQQYNCQKVSSF